MDALVIVAGLLHELGVAESALSLVVAHARAVDREGDRLGLISDRGLETILIRHSADSLLFALARRPEAGELWLDAGSGAGFPGMVLACAFPGTRFLLIEPQQRRTGFLDLISLNLGLSNVEVSRKQVGRMPSAIADVVVARALEKPEETLPDLRRLLAPGGTALVAAGQATPVPEGAEVLDVARASVDSPGRLLMMPARL